MKQVVLLCLLSLISSNAFASYDTNVECKSETCLILPEEAPAADKSIPQGLETTTMLLKADLLPNDEELKHFDSSFSLQVDLDKMHAFEQRYTLERTLVTSQEYFRQQLYYIPDQKRVSVSSKGR